MLKIFWHVLVLVSLLERCTGVIYHLTDIEYDRMPPIFSLDEYHGCLRQPGGVYCLAQVVLTADPAIQLMHIIKEYSEHTTKHYNHTEIQRGVCLKKTCANNYIYKEDKTVDPEATLGACLNESIWNEYGLQASLSIIFYCDSYGQETKIDTSDWIVAAVITLVLIVNLVGSLYDVYLQRNKSKKEMDGNQILLCFSVMRNWQWLVSRYRESKFESLKGFNGVKSIVTFLMVIAHVNLLNGTYTDNPHDFEKAYESLHFGMIFNGMTVVQLYFVISGFLLVYLLEAGARAQPATWRALPRLLLMRWWRLTPTNALMLALTATWLRHLGSGPLWNMYVTGSAADCRRYWWHHLLYFNNYSPEHGKTCALHTWYIAADLQLFCLGVIVYIATRTRGRALALGSLLLVGVVTPGLHVWWYNLDGVLIMNPETFYAFVNDTYYYLHVLGHNNICSYVGGMIAGQLVWTWQQSGLDLTKYKTLRYMFWCVLPVFLTIFYMSSVMFYGDADQPTLAFRVLYQSTNRSILSAAATFFIVGLVMKFDDTVRGVMEWDGWTVPSRLSYSLYIVHMMFVHVLLGARTTLGHVSFYHTLIAHIGVVALSFLLAVPVCLLVEAPMNYVLKRLTSEGPGDQKCPGELTTEGTGTV